MHPFARQVIDICGGAPMVADLLGVQKSTVYKWTYPVGRSNGSGGLIPAATAMRLLAAAKDERIDLRAEDFYMMRETEEVEVAK